MNRRLSEVNGAAPAQAPSWVKLVRRLVYWGLPPVLLLLIFGALDWGHLNVVIVNVKWATSIFAASLISLVIFLGALRWHVLLMRNGFQEFRFSRILQEYWKSLALGVLAPGSLGSDAYRVFFIGVRTGRYWRGGWIIFLEKILALISCVFVIAICFPLVTLSSLTIEIMITVVSVYLLITFCVGILLFLIVSKRSSWNIRFMVWMRLKVESFVLRVQLMVRPGKVINEKIGTGKVFSEDLAIFDWRTVFSGIFISLAIQLVTATQAQLYFYSVGYDISFFVNLFVSQLIFFIFIFPVSFGGIGVREGAYVILYGAFGVPVEVALVVSFSSFLGILLGHAVGALLFLLDRNNVRDSADRASLAK